VKYENGGSPNRKKTGNILLLEYLVDLNFKMKKWDLVEGDLDNNLILLELDSPLKTHPRSFKINSSWFEDPSFKTSLKDCWTPHNSSEPESPPL
jgi:hypothetical protein